MNVLELFEGRIFGRTREEVNLAGHKIYENVKKNKWNEVLFDFSGISFIPISFADEFWVIKEKFEKNGINTKFINMCEDVKRMFEVVERATKKPAVKEYIERNIEVIEI